MTVDIERVIIPAVLIIATTAVLFIIRSVAFRLLHAWAKKTETGIDDIIIKSLKVPSLYWILALGLYAGLLISDLPEKYVFLFSKSIHIIINHRASRVSLRIYPLSVSMIYYRLQIKKPDSLPNSISQKMSGIRMLPDMALTYG